MIALIRRRVEPENLKIDINLPEQSNHIDSSIRRTSRCNWDRSVAASGVGKSETRKRLVSEPLEYIFAQPDIQIGDFEVSKFTRAGELQNFEKKIFA